MSETKYQSKSDVLLNIIVCLAIIGLLAFVVITRYKKELLSKPVVAVQDRIQVDSTAIKDSIYTERAKEFDDLLRYMVLHDQFKQLRMENEIKYLRTGKEKYRLTGNRYDDSAVKYAKLFHRMNNKIQSNKQ
jgi:hypothetical protein